MMQSKLFRVASAAGLFALAAMAVAQPTPGFSYKGVPLGAPLTDFKAAIPALQCYDTECSYSMSICVSDEKLPVKPGPGSRRAQCDDTASFGGAHVVRGTIKTHEGKAGFVYLAIHETQVNQLLASLTEAYGPPSKSEDVELVTRAGVRHPSWVKTWTRGSETLQFRQMAGSVTEGGVFLSTAEFMAAEQAKRSQATKKGAKDF